MYIPRRYEEKDENQISEFIKQNSFGILITTKDGLPVGTHIPFLIKKRENKWFLSSHISKGNEQKFSLQNGIDVLVIFSGPHAYISPTWYKEINVPTWNYIAVHAYGKIRLMEFDELKKDLSMLINMHEKFSSTPMKIEDIPEKIFNDDIRGIVGFEIEINRFQAAYKLSQNRDEESYKNVINELSKRGEMGKEVAKEMQSRENKLFDKK